jgi:hypothetical protein
VQVYTSPAAAKAKGAAARVTMTETYSVPRLAKFIRHQVRRISAQLASGRRLDGSTKKKQKNDERTRGL